MLDIGFDWKLMATIGAVICGNASFIPYFWDLFKGRTQPHLYTWLIWLITQGTGAVALIYGGGGVIGYGLLFATFLMFLVVLLSFKYGTKNVTRKDAIVLVFAILSIIVWWQLKNPFLAVLMVSLIDAVGYLPTYRKLYEEPWSESLSSWISFTAAYILSLIALDEYNLLTVPYISVCLAANLTLLVICLTRRRIIPKPA